MLNKQTALVKQKGEPKLPHNKSKRPNKRESQQAKSASMEGDRGSGDAMA